MPRSRTRKSGEAGFSLQEILVVVAIGTVVTITALPRMTTAIANAKLRASMTSVSGLIQNSRMTAVQQNKTKTARYFNRTTEPYSLVYYVKDASDSSTTVAAGDTQIEMEAPITPYDSPSGTGAPSAISNSALGMSASPLTTDPSFNSRGLPCSYSGGTCTTNVGFIKYFKDNRISSATGGWAAISVSPAGRIKRWFYNGTSWTD